jgi:serine/threonine-protein kinase
MVSQVISHYRILEKLGEGGMGVVYRAHDSTLDRLVALKFLPSHLISERSEKDRFYHEARAASSLNHPNITTIYEICEHDEKVFLAMEYVEGETLKALASRSMLPLTEVLEVAMQIADGLAAAHEKGIVHRDIKSDNIMITPKGNVKIMDFGLAKVKGVTGLTRAGSTLGTAAYMSPEQARGEEVDRRTDIFSFGVVLYELITGKLPFRGEHEAALLYSVVNEHPLPMARFNDKVSPEVERVVAKALAKDLDERYQRVDDMLSDLRRERKHLDLAAAGYTSITDSTTRVRPQASQPGEVPAGGHPAAGAISTPKRKRRILYYLIAALVLGITGICFYLFLPLAPSSVAGSKTIAVLPFTNLAGDKEEEYFADGMTEDILTQLAKIGEINVISRTSVMQYKGTTKSIREIGKELNAGVIMEGSVRHAGDQVRIVAQLIDATNDTHLWAETYDREYKKIFVIQSEIAQKIASALKARLSPLEVEKLSAPSEANTAAYSLLLQGRYFANRRDRLNVLKAIDFYKRGLAIDSTDARIWAALADAYLSQMAFGQGGMSGYSENARKSALRAVALDEKLADGHRVLADVLYTNDWDWRGADRELSRALELGPGNAATLNRKSGFALVLGRVDEAIAFAQKAVSLDPVFDRSHWGLAYIYWYANRPRESMAEARKVLELSPQYPAARTILAFGHLALRNIDSAITEAKLEPDEFWRSQVLAILYHAAGRTLDSDQALQKLIEGYSTEGPFQIAEVYAFRGEADRAFEWLETASRLHDPGVTQILGDPLLKRIESDPRFAAYLKKLKLVE